jgi:hypothetical protein
MMFSAKVECLSLDDIKDYEGHFCMYFKLILTLIIEIHSYSPINQSDYLLNAVF